jgi:hypothetical protein
VSEDDKQDPTHAPGSSAADAAPTQEIPRIPKPATPAKKAPAKAPARKSAATRSVSGASQQTDKGRPRPAPPVEKQPEPTPEPEAKRQVKPSGGPTGRPLTAADYAHTTKQSPSATAVIPAVKDTTDKGRDNAKPAPAKPDVAPGSTRRASLRLTHVEPWSVTRLAFAISVAMMIVAVVGVTIFWVVLDATGVWDQINGSVTSVLSDDSSSFNITDYLGFGRMVGLTLVLSAINVILMTALATIGAHLYNLAAQLLGGVEVTFAEEK